jgi:hypothetical protein
MIIVIEYKLIILIKILIVIKKITIISKSHPFISITINTLNNINNQRPIPFRIGIIEEICLIIMVMGFLKNNMLHLIKVYNLINIHRNQVYLKSIAKMDIQIP